MFKQGFETVAENDV